MFHRELAYIEMADTKMYMFDGAPEYPGAAGALVSTPDYRPSKDGTVIYFACEDVAVEAGRIEGAGGKLLMPKTSIGEYGFMAMFLDTEGNKIGLHSMQ